MKGKMSLDFVTLPLLHQSSTGVRLVSCTHVQYTRGDDGIVCACVSVYRKQKYNNKVEMKLFSTHVRSDAERNRHPLFKLLLPLAPSRNIVLLTLQLAALGIW